MTSPCTCFVTSAYFREMLNFIHEIHVFINSLSPSFTLSLSPSLPSHQFTMMNMSMFKEIFTVEVEYLVERIQSNYALQIIPNSFLANSTTSPTFATILLNFLMER